MALWVVEVWRNDRWEVVAVEWEAVMALAIQDELEADGHIKVRALERSDLPPDEADQLLQRAWATTVEEMNRWEPYRWRAIARLHREGR